MDAIGAEKIAIVDLRGLGKVINLNVIAGPDGPFEHALHAPFVEGVVSGEQIQAIVAKAIQAAVADVHDMGLPPAQDQSGQGASHTLKVRVGAADRVDPAIHRLEGTGTFLPHPKKFALAQIAVDEAPHDSFGRHAAPLGPANPVRDSRDHPMARALRGSAIEDGTIVLIVGSWAPFRGIASRHTELLWLLLVERHAAP
jgi:hypothetical protein